MLPQTLYHHGGRLNLSFLDLTVSERQDFQQNHGVVFWLVAFNLVHDVLYCFDASVCRVSCPDGSFHTGQLVIGQEPEM
jgi:hypothetical protein